MSTVYMDDLIPDKNYDCSTCGAMHKCILFGMLVGFLVIKFKKLQSSNVTLQQRSEATRTSLQVKSIILAFP